MCTLNNKSNEYCYVCGIKLMEDDVGILFHPKSQKIPSDKIILLDLNYVLIKNSKDIHFLPLGEKI